MSSASFSLLQGDPTTWGLPPVGKTFMGINASGQLVLKQNNGTITPVISSGPGGDALSNSVGTTTINPTAGNFSALVNVSGSARRVPIVLATAGLLDWQQLDLRVDFPALDNLFIDIYNTAVSGPPLSTFQAATGSGITSALWQFRAQSGAWVILSNQVPASS
jgi:uncharacterized protein Usg